MLDSSCFLQHNTVLRICWSNIAYHASADEKQMLQELFAACEKLTVQIGGTPSAYKEWSHSTIVLAKGKYVTKANVEGYAFYSQGFECIGEFLLPDMAGKKPIAAAKSSFVEDDEEEG